MNYPKETMRTTARVKQVDMSWIDEWIESMDMRDAPEIAAAELERIYPGFHESYYLQIVRESLKRHTGGSGGWEWAETAVRLEWLTLQRQKEKPNTDSYFE